MFHMFRMLGPQRILSRAGACNLPKHLAGHHHIAPQAVRSMGSTRTLARCVKSLYGGHALCIDPHPAVDGVCITGHFHLVQQQIHAPGS